MRQVALILLALFSLTFLIGANCDSGDFSTSYIECDGCADANGNCYTQMADCPPGECTTGYQSFINGTDECNVLEIDADNNFCAINQRTLDFYTIGCSGGFGENPPPAISSPLPTPT